MAKKKSASKKEPLKQPKDEDQLSSSTSDSGADETKLSRPTKRTLNSRLRRIDQDLVSVINERAEIVAELAKRNAEKGEPTVSLVEEDDFLADIAYRSKGPLDDASMQIVFREIVSACRGVVKPLRVAFLGPLYSYSHLAVTHRFGQSVNLAPVSTIPAVFEEVKSGNADFGLVPIENSTDGRVTDTLDMFTKTSQRICGQVELAIHHTLLAKCRREDIREVYSKPQALSQCRNWLAKHLPGAQVLEMPSTSRSAEIAVEKKGAAAIASREAGLHYGLSILAEKIEDNTENVTRFALIGDHAAEKTGNDRTAVLFQTEHHFGALVDALAVFKRVHVNMTWIESFPVPGSDRLYLFFIELEGHELDLKMRRALEALGRKTLRLDILGSFPAAEIED
jgi:chorismate mutase / prephenate dehydratase